MGTGCLVWPSGGRIEGFSVLSGRENQVEFSIFFLHENTSNYLKYFKD